MRVLSGVDVTEIFHEYGFNRVPMRARVAEWWQHTRGGGRSWYRAVAVMEIYGEKQVPKILENHIDGATADIDHQPAPRAIRCTSLLSRRDRARSTPETSGLRS